jgi:hypothetical protein
MQKVRRYHTWNGPVISLGLGEHPWGVGVEAYRWAGGRWHEVDAIEVEFKAPEIGEAHFEVRHPIAYSARRWLPRTEAVKDPEETRLDNILATLEELKAERERRAKEGEPSPDTDHPPEAAA